MNKLFKGIGALMLAFAMTMSFASCGNDIKEPSIKWRADTTQKYLENNDVTHLITVQASQQHDAVVTLFEKTKLNGKTIWTEILNCEAYIGKNGLGKTKEGDYMTPIGDFGIVTAFGIKSNPGTKLPYIDVTDDIYACCDEKAYNKIININDVPHKNEEDEHMIEYTPEYNYGFQIDYNKDREVGVGNSIFFHCKGTVNSTGGCIALAEADLVEIMKKIDKNTRVIIDYMPQ